VAVFGFAWWDRRSILITARKAAREEAEQCTRGIRDDDRKIDRLIDVLRGLAEKMYDFLLVLGETIVFSALKIGCLI
jgi:hypothetical protein